MSGIWDNSSFLDLTGYGVTTATTPEQAFNISSPQAATSNITVALVLPRLNDPTALLGESWAQREATLNGLTPTQVGALYGADPAQYAAVTSYLSTVSGATMLTAAQGYVSSAQSRTVWVSLNAQAFKTLFNQPLLSPKNNSFNYWDGTLTPNAALGPLGGLWVPPGVLPPATPQYTTGVTLPEGPQGVGNTAGGGYGQEATLPSQELYPNQIAAEYNFPLTTSGVATPTIGLVEPGYGTAVAAGSDPNQLVQTYRAEAGIAGTGTLSNGPVQGPTSVPTKDERSLDVGVIAAAAPNSNIVADAGGGDLYSTMEEAVWGGGAKLSDLSSSFTFGATSNPASPFFAAQQGLYQDAALNNISFFQDSGDGGQDHPKRDLYLSPGHPVLVGADADLHGGHLVPIMCLINGTSVRRVSVETVTYWHVELDAHDILLAENLPAESYLDWGDRGFFIEGADHGHADADVVLPGLSGRCRPVAVDGPVVEAERRRLDTVLAARLAEACFWPSVRETRLA